MCLVENGIFLLIHGVCIDVAVIWHFPSKRETQLLKHKICLVLRKMAFSGKKVFYTRWEIMTMEELWGQMIQSWPILQPLLELFSILVPLGLLLSFAGILFISVSAKIIGFAEQRIIFAKCARQLARLGLILGWLLLICMRIWLYFTTASHPAGSVENFVLELCWMLLSLGVLLSTIYYSVWGVLKNMPVLHATIGILAGIQNCLTLCCVILTIRLLENPSILVDRNFNLPEHFAFNELAPLWITAAYTIPLMFALAAALCACWLVIIRKWDDFGRDYYARMLKWCAAWARNAWGFLLLLFVAIAAFEITQNMVEEQFLIEEGIRFLLWLLPLLLWIFFCKSKLPLRNKWLLFFCLLLEYSFLPTYFVTLTLK